MFREFNDIEKCYGRTLEIIKGDKDLQLVISTPYYHETITIYKYFVYDNDLITYSWISRRRSLYKIFDYREWSSLTIFGNLVYERELCDYEY